jgi:hypothetical protein
MWLQTLFMIFYFITAVSNVKLTYEYVDFEFYLDKYIWQHKCNQKHHFKSVMRLEGPVLPKAVLISLIHSYWLDWGKIFPASTAFWWSANTKEKKSLLEINFI